MDLKEKIVLVTGGSRGIGAAIVKQFSENHAKVYFTYRSSKEEAETLTRSLKGEIHPLFCDVSQKEQVDKMVDELLEKEDRIDILVNNAGIIRDGLFVTMEEEDWKAVLDTNLGGVYHCCKSVVRPMMTQGGGRIINISSVVGELGGVGQANYAASKGAINSFTKALATELASKNILVNAVSPGMVDTQMSSAVRSLLGDKIKEKIPLGVIGEPSDIASAVVFLASKEARYITGQILTVDGGFSLLNRR